MPGDKNGRQVLRPILRLTYAHVLSRPCHVFVTLGTLCCLARSVAPHRHTPSTSAPPTQRKTPTPPPSTSLPPLSATAAPSEVAARQPTAPAYQTLPDQHASRPATTAR